MKFKKASTDYFNIETGSHFYLQYIVLKSGVAASHMLPVLHIV